MITAWKQLYSTKFDMFISTFFQFTVFLQFPFRLPLTYGLFGGVLFNFQVFEDLPMVFLLLVSN